MGSLDRIAAEKPALLAARALRRQSAKTALENADIGRLANFIRQSILARA